MRGWVSGRRGQTVGGRAESQHRQSRGTAQHRQAACPALSCPAHSVSWPLCRCAPARSIWRSCSPPRLTALPWRPTCCIVLHGQAGAWVGPMKCPRPRCPACVGPMRAFRFRRANDQPRTTATETLYRHQLRLRSQSHESGLPSWAGQGLPRREVAHNAVACTRVPAMCRVGMQSGRVPGQQHTGTFTSKMPRNPAQHQAAR